MIIENMTAGEKIAQMNKVAPLLTERVDAFLKRNTKLIKRQFKTKERLEFNRPFRFLEYGEWDTFVFMTKISKEWAKITIHAYQRYYVRYAKDPSNIGAGFYVIQHSFEQLSGEKYLRFVDVTPHCVNRYRERVDGAADMPLDKLKTEIISEGGFGTCEYNVDSRSEDDPELCNCVLHTLNGQFFAWVTDGNQKYTCYRTFVSNEMLHREQIAYTIAQKECGKTNYDDQEIRESAEKLIVRMAKNGEDVGNIAEKKKMVMIRSSLNNVMSAFVRHISRDRISRILGGG